MAEAIYLLALKKTPNPISLPAPLLFSLLTFFRELDWQQTKPVKINSFYAFNSKNKLTEGMISNTDDDDEEE